MKAVILNIGNEVLSGKIINTNAAFLSRSLSKIGIETVKVTVVGDDPEAIRAELAAFEKSEAQVLLTTGGLGPTHDDLTKEVIVAFLGLELVEHQEAREQLEAYFGKNYAPCNNKQCLFPKEALILPNPLGTADGMIITHKGKTYVILVGPPLEMETMVEKSVIPYLTKENSDEFLFQEFIVMGQGESACEEILQPLYHNFSGVMIAPYAGLGQIRYLIRAPKTLENEFRDTVAAFQELLRPHIISEGEAIETVVVSRLKELGYRISFAESCTGGMLVARIVNVPGASSVFNESFVTYSDEAKSKYLGVNPETIAAHGVVSSEVVTEMAQGLGRRSQAEVAIAVSGIAGPDGGSPEKPVGLVHYAIKINDRLFSEKQMFKGSRNQVRERTVMWILYRLFCLLKSEKVCERKAKVV